jgi:HD-GYP domain-containing protein (c-di-GMP phosphodiesterase class II)
MISRHEMLVDMGIALSSEMNHTRLLERILECAKTLAHADGGSLYTVDDETATILIMHNDTIGVRLGGTAAEPPRFPPVPLYKTDGSPNLNNVVTYAVHRNTTVNVRDSYSRTDGFDFSGTAKFDLQTGYRSISLLTVPLRNHENAIIGVLQLINAIAPRTRRIVAFDSTTQRLVEALSSQAAIALTKEYLIRDLKNLFEALTRLIASAIDNKSPYTGGHCRRVPEITMLLAEAAHRSDCGPLKDFRMDDSDRYELEIASWLHDCGKIATPEHIMDKATKLETVFDRIELVETRYEILLRDAEIAHLKRRLAAPENGEAPGGDGYLALRLELEEEREFLRRCNTGSEFMSDEDKARVRQIGARSWVRAGQEQPALTADEMENLCIPRGTLTDGERKIINNHIAVTIEMLESLPFPKHLRNVVEYAGGHHERMDGKGYPKGLVREQMSLPARILAIADIFEALTASDRPYKPGKKLSESLAIMGGMKRNGHIDPDLFDVFVREKVYLAYAEKYLDPSQIDGVDEGALLS